MNNLIETIDYKGFEIEVCYDNDPQSPDEWGNDDAFLVYDHRDFTVRRKGFDPDEIFQVMQANKKTFDGYYYFPVYAYIHSGVSLSLGRNTYPFTCNWDTSFKGFVLVQRTKGMYKEDIAYNIAKGIVNEWNEYLSGEVYGYSSEVGSCWGFYGDDGKKYMIEDAKSEIDLHIKEENKKALQSHLSTLKTWLKNRVPLYIRKPFELPYSLQKI